MAANASALTLATIQVIGEGASIGNALLLEDGTALLLEDVTPILLED